ncbi:hypothetical protein ACHQM5_030594 [Ranunculus cassubicifolius]
MAAKLSCYWRENILVLVGSDDSFWRENIHGRWATLIVLLFIFLWHTLSRWRRRFHSPGSNRQSQIRDPANSSQTRTSETVSDVDLTTLMKNLEGIYDEEVKWDDVVDKKSNSLSYIAKSYKPKNGPLTYMSVTIFENCSAERLRDFYMDNEYRVQWDKTIVDHKQLQVDEMNGVEFGRTVKKFPLLTPREYILAWRLWEGKEKTFYCFSKECEHPLAPLQKKYVRVGYFRSGWRIRNVPGRNACEIKVIHQEDAGLNVDMAKLVFSKGIWSYVCKMDVALRKYVGHCQSNSVATAVTLMQKVPSELDTAAVPVVNRSFSTTRQESESREKKTLLRRPSGKMIANGLLVIGGVLCLTRGHSSLSTKIAMACILKKLTNHKAISGQSVPGPS